MSDRRRGWNEYALDVFLVAGVVAAGLYLGRTFLSTLEATLSADPEKDKNERARLRAEQHIDRLRRSKRDKDLGGSAEQSDSNGVRQQAPLRENLDLNEYESLVAMEMVAPEDIPVQFDDIGGLEETIEELKESVIYPLTMPHLYSHATPLLSAPSGVLLYGPPGCGKTMMAKAVARESGASFINLHISTVTEKWYGDSNKLVRAVFSLARKMQPAIIFIDEIDAVLGTRRSGEHEASGMVKAEFMTLWDGLTSANAKGEPARIVVLGATNRMHDIDEAILRRLPKKFAVPLPNVEQRRRILQLVLHGTKTDDEDFDMDYIAQVTDGMSGSDIKAACRDAAMMPVREYMRQHRGSGKSMLGVRPEFFRGVRNDDFFGRRGGNLSLREDVRRALSAVEDIPQERID